MYKAINIYEDIEFQLPSVSWINFFPSFENNQPRP